uniref:DEP domain-containing protein 5-like n=1 Tax=Phallusia mammillata TaxID=59560 RepID=A0A6F9DBD4_9ASCI|nr:DEP domain-containing protein 5-like [Phallusia mammillata]
MKPFKLKIHPQNFSGELLVFNASDFPDVQLNDLLKISHYNNSSANFILIQVKSVNGDISKGTISIHKDLAGKACFNFQVFQDVNVVKVEPEDVTIDLLEVSFKDQYISRSDMLRMKKHLLNSCVHIEQFVEFSEIKAQVSEMWANSVQVKCGFISDHTNFVLRSSTAKVYLFIQMSAEMWEYDAYGYLQFERAVNGFLKALFTKWKEKCCHELTLVLFSRTLYDTKNLTDFPPDVREVVRKNYKGQYYLDFYKCVVQTERMDDCTPLVKELKILFHKYESITEIPGCPPGQNSTSSEGNFLEAINMALNVFDRHYVDRNLDRTGQIVVCITPGVGVFDVDRDLTILTKERMIDNGIGSDLICLGQQPLHAVPLFKFHHSSGQGDSEDLHSTKPLGSVLVQDFNIPHWINHSFYTINPFCDKGTTNINYIPRIHVAQKKSKKFGRKVSTSFVAKATHPGKDESDLPTLQQTNYEEFDRQVFGFSRYSDTWKQLASDSVLLQKTSATPPDMYKKRPIKSTDEWAGGKQKSFETRYSPDGGSIGASVQPSRPVHIPLSKSQQFSRLQQGHGMASSVGMTANLEKYYQVEQNMSAEMQPVIGSANLTQNMWKDSNKKAMQRRALFNPFNPSHMFAPLTANRRRWVHTYPRGPQGEALVMHHQNPLTRSISRSRQTSESTDDECTVGSAGFSPSRYSPANSVNFQRQIAMKPGSADSSSGSPGSSPSPSKNIKHLPGNESISWSLNPNPAENYSKGSKPIASYGLSWMWGIAGDIQWTSDTHTGLDWKSLKCPACLPITTDYHPTYAHLRSACTEQSYFLVPDDGEPCTEDDDTKQESKKPCLEIRSSKEVFQELINQRLCQGFQIIKQTQRMRANDSTSSAITVISPNTSEMSFISQMCGTSPLYSSPRGLDELKASPDTCMLSHGRQYHLVKFVQDDDKIEVVIFKPRHPFDTVTVEYGYMLWPKTRGQFQPSRCSFAHEKVEDYPWNHHDNYVCCLDSDLQLASSLKCWKAKFVVLPNPIKRLQALKRDPETGMPCYDAFDGCNCEKSHASYVEGGECGVMTEGFIRFLDFINKIKRPNSQAYRKSWKSFANFSPSLSKSYTSLSTLAQPSGSHHATPTPPTRPTSGTPTSDRSTPVSQQLNDSFSTAPISMISSKVSHAVDAKPVPVKTFSNASGDKANEHKQGEGRRHSLTCNSELTDIVAALIHPETGLCFMPDKSGFPNKTFVSLEAVHWALANIGGLESIKDACRLFEIMCNYTLINHASGNKARGFIYGYVFYSVKDEQQSNDIEDPTSYQYMSVHTDTDYHNQWFEVAIKRKDLAERQTGKSLFGDKDISAEGKSGAFYVTPNRDSPRSFKSFPEKQTARIPLTNKQRTNRTEWTEIKYSTGVRAGADSFIFSFEMHWMVATASCISNMLQLWARKASSNDLYLLPVPSDPFSFPRSGASGPLRSPLFVPLNVKDLLETTTEFKELAKNMAWYREAMISFMEAILHRFGFIQDDTESRHLDANAKHTISQNYIHCTGQAFAQIPVHNHMVQRHSISLRHRPTKRSEPSESQSHQQNFMSESELNSTGFYWSTNYMQTKRWRLTSEYPAHDIEQSFVRFCSNSEGRLSDFFLSFMTEFVASN